VQKRSLSGAAHMKVRCTNCPAETTPHTASNVNTCRSFKIVAPALGHKRTFRNVPPVQKSPGP
jgi:hypothetical protein